MQMLLEPTKPEPCSKQPELATPKHLVPELPDAIAEQAVVAGRSGLTRSKKPVLPIAGGDRPLPVWMTKLAPFWPRRSL
jgi:hypothetical protein